MQEVIEEAVWLPKAAPPHRLCLECFLYAVQNVKTSKNDVSSIAVYLFLMNEENHSVLEPTRFYRFNGRRKRERQRKSSLVPQHRGGSKELLCLLVLFAVLVPVIHYISLVLHS